MTFDPIRYLYASSHFSSREAFTAFVLSVIALIAFSISAVIIVVGILGIVMASTKHAPKDKWVSLLKKGLIISFIGIVALIAMSVQTAIFGVPLGSSFTEDTEVLTPNGKVKIVDLKEGDSVFSFNTKTKIVTTEKVEKYRSHKADSYYIINGTLKVTSEHPFAVKNSVDIAWRKVKDLLIGDLLITNEGKPLVIKSIEMVSVDEQIVVYNPQVSGERNYFVMVGDKSVLVHNKTSLPSLED